jgi:translocation and assembly module TamB
LSGRPLEGALTLEATAERQQQPDRIVVKFDGSINRLRTGVPVVDALGGGSVVITGAGQRDAVGIIHIERLMLGGAGGGLGASGHFDPATRQLAAMLDADIRQLQPLGVALDMSLAGHLTAHLDAEGPIDRPRLQARIDGADVAAGPAILDRLRLDAVIADLAQPLLAVSGEFRGGGLDGTLALEADLDDRTQLAIRRLQVRAAESVVEGDLRIDLDRLLTRGALRARVPDLSRWSRLAGIPIAGIMDVKAGLKAQRGQSLELTLSGDRLAAGSGGSRVVIGHVAVTTRLSDLLGTPSGKAQVSLTGATFQSVSLASASFTLDGARPGRFAFTADAKGKVIDPLTLALGGEVEIAPGIDMRLARLTGALGADRIQLTRPLHLSKRGSDLVLSDLALTIGPGQITGNAAQRGQALSMQVAARNLSIASAAGLLGYQDVGGTVTLDANLGGTVAAPQGRFTLSGRSLRFALPQQPRLPTLALDLDGSWNGRDIALNGRVSGLKGETIRLTGSVPLVLRPAPFAISLPPQGHLALRAQGAGELANLADLLPLGEDRFTGRFALDLSVNGTVGAPAASGQLTVSDGRYENFATGAVLTKMKVDLAGDRDRLILREFSADDTAKGTLSAQGSLVLGGSAPSAELTGTLKHFRIVARDEATVTTSGTVSVTGTIASPKVATQLIAEQGDITIPDRLPPSVTRLKVAEINSRSTSARAQSPKNPEPPALPAALDMDLNLPGRVFVRGRGLDSEWGGRIKITGTSTAPQIVGSLNALRGTVDLLGKSFKITRGRITFGGSGSPDPALDILAEVSSGDVTAQVLVGGLTSSPTVSLTSTPTLPQDEILARVLFNRGVGQITAAEGIQVAQAAATLADGGPGVLDRLRGRLGLDRLVFGSAPPGTASSNLSPAAGGNAATSAAISGGKYVAQGVYVGATQGLTPQSSKVTVEIEVRPHVTVETDLSQAAGTGIGLNYKYDY